jgi:hypothetical protein
MSVKLKTPSNGSVTLAPEDTASDVTLTVPAGTSSLVSNTTLRTELNATGSAPIYACRAWCNFDGTTATPSTIRGSGNVSSVTKNGTGDYTINFTTAMPDTNYSAVMTPCRDIANDTNMQVGVLGQTGFATGSVRLQTRVASSSTIEDAFAVSVAIFR